jgi:hypothetical protein
MRVRNEKWKKGNAAGAKDMVAFLNGSNAIKKSSNFV